MWIAALFYILATFSLIIRIKKNDLPILYPISIYLGGISTFFVLMGIFQIINNINIVIIAALAVMIGSATITRFVLRLEVPNLEKFVYYLLLAVAFTIAVFTYSIGQPPIILRSAHAFAFVTAGLFTMGYIIYSGFKSQSSAARVKSVSTGISLGLCCVVAHGLAFSQLIVIAIPLLGFTINAPMLFALMSPLAFIMVLVMTRHMGSENVKITYSKDATGAKTTISTMDLTKKPGKNSNISPKIIKKRIKKVKKTKKK
jgi:hypothetical protein